jgi:hypothetical protein
VGVGYLDEKVRNNHAGGVPRVYLQMIATVTFRNYVAALVPINDTSAALDNGLGRDVTIEGSNDSRHEAGVGVATTGGDRLAPEGQASFDMTATKILRVRGRVLSQC